MSWEAARDRKGQTKGEEMEPARPQILHWGVMKAFMWEEHVRLLLWKDTSAGCTECGPPKEKSPEGAMNWGLSWTKRLYPPPLPMLKL